MTDSQWETVIGLEIHVQLSTKSKIFSDASTVFGGEPNEQANEIDLTLSFIEYKTLTRKDIDEGF